MVKRIKFDDLGDVEDLQALFDSIATGPAKPSLEVVTAEGEGDDLQALFDAVASEFHDSADSAPVAAPPREGEPWSGGGDVFPAPARDAVFRRVGQLTRRVHDTLNALGCDGALPDSARAVPDTRQRLIYIARMTAQVANRVRHAADLVQPVQGDLLAGAEALHGRWDKLYANQLTTAEFKALAAETRGFLGGVAEGGRATRNQVREILAAQDFQDLAGPLLERLVSLIHQLEVDLIQVLVDTMPAGTRRDTSAEAESSRTSARVPGASSPEQVDALLESLGF